MTNLASRFDVAASVFPGTTNPAPPVLIRPRLAPFRSVLRRLKTPAGGVALLIVSTFFARLLLAQSMGLGIDESYMAAAGRMFQLGYFDHPPVAWWLTWAAERLAGVGADAAIRMPFILLFALSTWLMFRFASDLFGARAGFWAAALMNAVPVLGVTTGTWVLPDGPLIAALLGAAVCFWRAVSGKDAAWGWWLGSGACFGLAVCSKYTAFPVGLGAALFMLTQPAARPWLAKRQPYVAALVSFAPFAPVLAWNAGNGWASLAFQGSRADSGHWHPFGPITTLAGEALFFLPWIWVLLAACLWSAVKRGPADSRRWLLACLSLPSILLFELVSLRGHVLFHWTAPATMLALPLLGDVLGRVRPGSRIVQFGLAGTVSIVLAGVLLVGTEIRFNWLPRVAENFAMGTDPDLDAVNWTSLRTELDRRGELGPGAVVAATRWADAGKVDYALRGLARVICLGNDPRQYGLSSPAGNYATEDILIVAPRETLSTIRSRFGFMFDHISELQPVTLLHAGRPAMILPLFRGYRSHSGGTDRGDVAS